MVTKTGRNTIVLKLPATKYHQRLGDALAHLADLCADHQPDALHTAASGRLTAVLNL
jgi:hypothetical protein